MDAHKLKDKSDRAAYATDMGFYLGDKVELPDGRTGYIDQILLHNVNFQVDPDVYESLSVVRIDDELWLDRQLTRIA